MLKFNFLFGQFKNSRQFCNVNKKKKMNSIKRYMCNFTWKNSAERAVV